LRDGGGAIFRAAELQRVVLAELADRNAIIVQKTSEILD